MALPQTTIVGRLTADPEVKTVNVNGENQTVANFSVAVGRNFGNGTDFYDVVVWRRVAENVGKYLKKGRQVLVSGSMQQRSYTAQTPVNKEEYERRVWELKADRVEFLGSGQNSDNTQSGGYQRQNQNQPQAQEENPFYDSGDLSDDDLPF